MPREPGRPDPELLLQQVQAEERQARRGRLKVFLGYASGVGKTFTMMDEARRRRLRGEDVVVGAVQPQLPPQVDSILKQLEVIPMREVSGLRVMDIGAIRRRHPQVCFVDGLAYDNPPGAVHAHRWQDVEELLNAGIGVVASINLQYIEERRVQVEQITGKRVDQSVPLAFVQSADEIALVDAPTDELPSIIAGAGHDERQQQLLALREIALLLAADVVDHQLEEYLVRHGVAPQWGTQERILVCITARSDAAQMIASGARNATRFHGELCVVYVKQVGLTPGDQATLDRNLERASEAGAQVVVLESEDPIGAILELASERGITQIFIGHTGRRSWRTRLWGGPVDRLIRRADGIDVQVFPHTS